MTTTPGLLPGVGFIMGCATGIGRSTAMAFAIAGVRGLVLADINQEGLAETAASIRQARPSLSIVLLLVDIASEESCISCVRDAVNAFGRVDYVLNNVGIGGNHTSTLEQDKSELMKVMNINFVGLWVSQREQVRHMLLQDKLDHPSGRGNRGVITNTASILGLVGGPQGASPYAASKHAILGITKTEAATYGKEGIRINALCPGYVSTAILGNNDPEAAAAIKEKILPTIPMMRLGEVEEIADCVVFLSSHMASYLSGTALVVDGFVTHTWLKSSPPNPARSLIDVVATLPYKQQDDQRSPPITSQTTSSPTQIYSPNLTRAGGAYWDDFQRFSPSSLSCTCHLLANG